MNIKLTINELTSIDPLGWLAKCNHCGCPTYHGQTLDEKYPTGVTLPDGINSSNRRKYVTVRGLRILICTKCRYDVYGAY
jgi:hypothetical protein